MRSARTFGLLFRVYGCAGDLDGVSEDWHEMGKCCVDLAGIMTGCMAEALVVNDGPEAGCDLLREIRGDEQMRPLIHRVIYNFVLKGFA